jgi:hypothetical protein
MMGLSLTAEAYGEIRAKLVALGLQESRIQTSEGLEIMNLNDFIFTKEKGDDNINVYIAYNGKLIKTPQEKK